MLFDGIMHAICTVRLFVCWGPQGSVHDAAEDQPILNPSTDHALSAAHCSRKNLMFIGVINKRRLLLPSDSLLIRCACVLIGDASLQAHSPYLESQHRACAQYCSLSQQKTDVYRRYQ